MRLSRILDIPKTLYFNFYYLPFKDALKIPFRVDYRTIVKSMGKRGNVTLKNPSKKIVIGRGESFALGGTTYWEVSPNGKIDFAGSAVIGKGSQIIVCGGITIGDNFYCNANCIINASKEIEIGDDFLMGWNGIICDGDGHNILHDNHPVERSRVIHIGNHVWCAANVTVLKGSRLPDDTIVAFGGVITKEHSNKNILLGGINKCLAENVSWKK